MHGFIRFEHDDTAEFGFGAPIPDLAKMVVFDVTRVQGWRQRNEPHMSAVIGRIGSQWMDAATGAEFDQVGIYLGGQRVLTAQLRDN